MFSWILAAILAHLLYRISICRVNALSSDKWLFQPRPPCEEEREDAPELLALVSHLDDDDDARSFVTLEYEHRGDRPDATADFDSDATMEYDYEGDSDAEPFMG